MIVRVLRPASAPRTSSPGVGPDGEAVESKPDAIPFDTADINAIEVCEIFSV